MRASRWVMSLRMSAPRGGIGGGGGPGVLCWRARVVERVAEEHHLVAHAAGRPQRRVIPPFLVRLDQLVHGRTQVLGLLGGQVEVHLGGERRLLPGGRVADDPHQPLPGPGQPAVDPDRRDGVRGEPGLGVLPRRGGLEGGAARWGRGPARGGGGGGRGSSAATAAPGPGRRPPLRRTRTWPGCAGGRRSWPVTRRAARWPRSRSASWSRRCRWPRAGPSGAGGPAPASPSGPAPRCAEGPPWPAPAVLRKTCFETIRSKHLF